MLLQQRGDTAQQIDDTALARIVRIAMAIVSTQQGAVDLVAPHWQTLTEEPQPKAEPELPQVPEKKAAQPRGPPPQSEAYTIGQLTDVLGRTTLWAKIASGELRCRKV